MKLTGQVIRIEDLTTEHINQMFRLMLAHYENVLKEKFLKDLSEKDCAIVLENSEGIKGFSTVMKYEHSINNKTVIIAFSGDTIIDKSYWGTLVLPITFGKMMLKIKAQYREQDLYWFLISKGYRTYRFLPTFFKSYYPNLNGIVNEFEKQLLGEIAQTKFGRSFDNKTYIIKAQCGSQCVKPGISDISNQRRKNKHIAFYERLNPGYVIGDELACIAKFDRDNLTPFILKHLSKENT